MAAAEALGPAPAAWPARADHAYWRAEIALAQRDVAGAEQALAGALTAGPTRMGLLLQRSRAGFFAGSPLAAQAALERFNALKADQTGTPPPVDLRDRITEDLKRNPTGPHPAACARALRPRTPQGATGRIPAKLWHYWQGAMPGPAHRGLRAWADQHPGMAQTLLDDQSARAWLATHAPQACAVFDRFAQPALRADLVRVALMAVEGGVFADLDEYPRMPVDPWLEGAKSVLVIESGYGTLANNFLAAEPELPIFRDLLDDICLTLQKADTPYPWWHSGPARLTVIASAHLGMPGLRLIDQATYDRRIATNLPFPHKSGPDHWR